MKYFLSFFALVFSYTSYGQITITDTVHCLNVSLHAEVTGGIIPTSSGITADDGYSGVIPIGFTYDFYGTPETQLLIGSNGVFCFDLTLAGGYNPWPISAPLLGNSSAYNSICGPWCDIYIPAGGTIEYSLQGTAPNRNFAVTWCGTAMYSCTTQWITTQIIIYETSNIAEVHIGHKTICAGWNGGAAICGVQNAAGTAATVAPGRDYPAMWSVTNEAWRFTPVGTTSYTVSSIPYAPIPYAASAIYWYDSTTGAYLGTGANIVVTPDSPTTYTAAALGCNDTTRAYIHISAVTLASGGLPHITSISSTNPSVCGECNGTVTLTGLAPHNIDSVFYSINGVAQPIIVDSAGTDSTIHLNGLCAGVYNYFYIKIGNCPTNIVGPLTLAAPPLHMALDTLVKLGCTGDLLQVFNSSTPTGPDYTSLWDFGDTTATSSDINPTHTYLYQGIHTVHFTYSTIFGCSVDTTFNVNTLHPLVPGYNMYQDPVCFGVLDSFINTTTSAHWPTYAWYFDDGSPKDTATNASHTFAMGGKYNVELIATDTIGCSASITQTIEVVQVDVHTSVHDTSVCLVNPMQLHAYPVILPNDNSVIYQVSWMPDTILVGSTTATPDFFAIGTYDYTVDVVTSFPITCSASDTEKIISYPIVQFTNLTASPQTVDFGGSVQLNADGAVYYNWTPDNGTIDNPNINDPTVTPRDSTTIYTVYGMNLFGCLDSAKVTVYLNYNLLSDMPSAFTPNNDGRNDFFHLTNLHNKTLVDFRVFNRWGEEVFHTSNPSQGWDGTYHGVPQDMGVYNYQVIVGEPDGTTNTYKGSVTLIR